MYDGSLLIIDLFELFFPLSCWFGVSPLASGCWYIALRSNQLARDGQWGSLRRYAALATLQTEGGRNGMFSRAEERWEQRGDSAAMVSPSN